ncbi:MAG: Superoxide dismutase [Parcubacteria group bacterium GW2011_GWC2_52_8c]|nr:MAG: Superoxide dismutase [Parcubacteria group bacterium GW2011_GWC2_52_8c]
MDPKPLNYTSLEGLSEKQLKEHHDVLYAGYVKKTNEIREALKTADTAGGNFCFERRKTA